MPSFCCVCSSRSNRDTKLRFFKIPKILNFPHKPRLNELSRTRRQKWLVAIKKTDWPDIKLKYAQVCSKHFISGEAAKLEDDSNPDWVPFLNMEKKKRKKKLVKEDICEKRRKKLQAVKVYVKDLREKDTEREATDVESPGDRPNKLKHKQRFPRKRLKVELDSSQPSDEWKDFIFFKDEDISEDNETETLSVINPERPLGDKIFRVCRTCLKIMNTEDAIPLAITGIKKEMELYNKLRSVFQLDFFPMENSCLCRQCKDFINAVYDFKSTCKLNEDVLREFDWTNKTRDLLHVVDQEELKTKYDQIVNSSHCCETKVPVQETVEETNWENLNEKGNGLSDLEDHWYDVDKSDSKVDHNYARNNEPEENIFSPEFDKYFKKLSGRVTSRLQKKCRRYHVKDDGKGPFLCDFCGKVKHSRSAYHKHVKLHQCSNGFKCTECNKTFSEWSSYINHCKIQHGGIPKTFECHFCFKKYTYKKYFDSHLKAHNKYICSKCGRVFNNNQDFKKHSDFHKRILCKICGKGFNGKSFRRHMQLDHSIQHSSNRSQIVFECNLCEQKYLKCGSLKLHKKLCHTHVNDVEIFQSLEGITDETVNYNGLILRHKHNHIL